MFRDGYKALYEAIGLVTCSTCVPSAFCLLPGANRGTCSFPDLACPTPCFSGALQPLACAQTTVCLLACAAGRLRRAKRTYSGKEQYDPGAQAMDGEQLGS